MFVFVFLFLFAMNGLPYVSDECRVSVLFLDRVFKVTGLGVVFSRGSGNDISRVPRFAAPDLRNGEYLQLAWYWGETGSHWIMDLLGGHTFS